MPIRISGLNSGLDTDSIVQELVSAYSYKKEKYVKAQTKLSWKMDAWKALNTKIYDFYTKQAGVMKFTSSYNKKATTVSDTTKATVTASSSAVNGTQTLEIKNLAKSAYLTGAKLTNKTDSSKKLTSESTLANLGYTGSAATFSITTNGETKSIDITSSTKISDVVKSLNAAGVTASFDATNQRLFISASESGAEADFSMTSSTEDGLTALNSLGLLTATDEDTKWAAYTESELETMADEAVAANSSLDKATVLEEYKNKNSLASKTLALTKNTTAVKIDGEDAQIVLNGATFTSKSNTMSVNGLNITALEKTTTAITVNTNIDVDGVYDSIKNFIKEYNALVNEMDSLYNATSAKGYDPLSSDEKDSMSDDEVEQWEKKIKDALLRRDSTLSSVSSAMQTSMQKSYEVNGSKYSLSSFGISTLGYFVSADNQKNAFHIDGNKDDENTGTNTDKLRAAITSDPEGVASFFSQLATDLYSELDTKMKSNKSLSSVYKVYNDKELQSEYDNYDDLIDKWEDKIKYYEDYYYKKFTAMETAMASLNSATSSISSLLGQ